MTLVIVGGGPAGLSAARAYRDAGGEGDVELVTAEPHHPYQRPPITKDLARGETDVEELFLEEEAWFADRVEIEDGPTLDADAVVLATGVRPAAELAQAAGLALDDGAVAADPALRSSDHAVLVAGDVAAAEHAVAGRRLHVEHWGDALAQGEIAGRVAAGEDATWRTAPGFWSTIGGHTLKLAAWGDGWDEDVVEADEGDRFVVRLQRDGRTVGVLASGDDDAYERGVERLEAGEW